MSSEQRSNSAVRNLRSLFENKSSDTASDARGRSPAGTLSPDAQDNSRPRSKVRASFIPVQPTMAALAAEQQQNDTTITEHRRESSAGLRRASMSEGHSGDALEMVRDAIESESDRRDRTSSVADMIPEQAIETPALEDKSQFVGKINKEPENPDKPVTGEQEEPAEMKPADPASEDAVSGGEALPPVAEDLRKDAPAKAKPSAISTKAPRPSMSSVKSPKSASSAKVPTKKPSRSSLTAPTAAYLARAAAADKPASSAPAPPKPKPRETTKPLDISSRLTAPTAASRARLESATNTAKAPVPASRPKPASTRPTPRSSIAGRPESRSSQNATKKPAAPVDGSFLERMTRPTAASASRAAEKTEVKSPPRQKQLPMRPKANGHAKGSKTASKTAAAEPHEESVLADESILPQEEDIPAGDATSDVKDTLNDSHAASAAVLENARKDLNEGKETPVHTNGVEDAPALENTPAAIGGEDSIR